jgi:hypothetical protein
MIQSLSHPAAAAAAAADAISTSDWGKAQMLVEHIHTQAQICFDGVQMGKSKVFLGAKEVRFCCFFFVSTSARCMLTSRMAVCARGDISG